MSGGARSRGPVPLQDALLALCVTAVQVLGVQQAAEGSQVAARPLSELSPLGPALLIASGLVLALRRRWPVPVFLLAVVASLAYFGLEFPDGPGWLALFVATYTLTAYGDGRRSLLVAGCGTAILAATWLAAAADVEPRAALGWVFFRIGATVLSAALGESVRSRRVVAEEAVERAELAERTREDEARARVDAERLRIAREVHDTVAHAIAVINVQAGVTAHVLDRRPDRAKEALEAIERTSSRALQEMRTILGVLRDDSAARDPRPGVDQIADLAARARAAGLDVRLHAGAPPAPLPTAVDGAVYRILQESITNVLRHVGPTRVTITLAYGEDCVSVRVTDGGRRGRDPARDRVPTATAADPGARPGSGIRGMRERCLLLGGDLSTRTVPGGGFQVDARLPLAPSGTR